MVRKYHHTRVMLENECDKFLGNASLISMNGDADCHELVHTYVSTETICDNSWCSPHVSYFASSEHGDHDVAGCQCRSKGPCPRLSN